jgi:hypothetical protein
LAGAYKEVKQEAQEHVGEPNVDAKEKDGDEFGIGVGSGSGGFGKYTDVPRTPNFTQMHCWTQPYSPIPRTQSFVQTTPRPKGPPQAPPPATPPFDNRPLPPVPAAPASSGESDYYLLANLWAQWLVSQREGRHRMATVESAINDAFTRGREIGRVEALVQQAATASIMQTPQPY